MNSEIKTLLKKTAKIAGVTCFALGGAAIIASGAALKALAGGAVYIKDSVKIILDTKPKATEESTATEECN